MTLETSIEYLKGVGPEKSKLISKAFDISTIEDLLNFYPIRYLDKSKVYKISELLGESQSEIQLKGKIIDIKEVSYGKNQKRLVAVFSDGTASMELVWFRYSKWFLSQLPVNREIYIFGKVTLFNGVFSISHPEIESDEKKALLHHLMPVYSGSEKLAKRGINNKFFQTLILEVLKNLQSLIAENLPLELQKRLGLISRLEAYQNIHFPKNQHLFLAADNRLKFEEAFFFQLGYGLKKKYNKTNLKGNPFPIIGDFFNDFYQNHLPFELTNAQKRVLKEIRNDMKKPIQMNRLVQGDVGSGKTMVALLSMLIALDNGFQSCMMAPTEILAQQHFNGISDLLKTTGIKVRLLTGSTKTTERRKIIEELISGELAILVGTHAILEDYVQFKNLGLAIIDEQHRFGVAQRAKLWAKNKIPPHILIMTATPIPRTLAMSFYSDLDVSVIDELPSGRKPIVTVHRSEGERLSTYQFIYEELKKGRQAYFVYPLIEESETLDYKNLEQGLEQIKAYFPDNKVVMLHGKMKSNEKDEVMECFAKGEAELMVATTVIEVGVNVPNASVMMIESAERFGLSQLHQLRGRVGRGAEQSYCILMTSDKLTTEGRKRIKTMCETNDGFKISEVDMQLRGPGDILGTQQSGVLDFKKLNLVKDTHIIKVARVEVEQLLEIDTELKNEKNLSIRNYYIQQYKGRNKWGRIS